MVELSGERSLYKIFLSFCFFFFKQKTAYELRISDWSSDVCSSDLSPSAPALSWLRFACCIPFVLSSSRRAGVQKFQGVAPIALAIVRASRLLMTWIVSTRSEEHTSELQSLMRISYAVFCLKKQTNTQLNSKSKSHY